jgi:hypothetical protein
MWDSAAVALDFVEFSHIDCCTFLLYFLNDPRDGALVKAKPLLYKRLSITWSASK